MLRSRLLEAGVVLAGLSLPWAPWITSLSSQTPADRVPTATLIPAAALAFPSDADSNSPAVWELIRGRLRLFLLTSVDGWPSLHAGTEVGAFTRLGDVAFEPVPPHGVWMESVIADTNGTWYGYYHHEIPAELCGDEIRTLPRIGAARSRNFGLTWEDLGTILEAPRGWHDCDTPNKYFVGGVGDFSVVRSHDRQDLYFFFSQYGNREFAQGVAVARLAWADRDSPQGRVSLWWRGSVWVPTRRVRTDDDRTEYLYPAGVPIYRAEEGWHSGRTVNAFWGPSVHWNAYLEQWVMLLNRARDADWRQEGIYVAFSKSLSDPTQWSAPQRLLSGGVWYPQVLGLEPGIGTDRLAGQRARFFMSGRSQYFIQFSR